MPPSKTRSHPEYDNRIEVVATQGIKDLDNVVYAPLLSNSNDITPYHQQTGARNWRDVYNNFSLESDYVENCLNANNIIILDDILTSGSHFRAAQEFIADRLPQIKKENIKGVFWAKAEY
jgi:pyrimidine operon attenuation protein/uracil phosphoribosyltransferase